MNDNISQFHMINGWQLAIIDPIDNSEKVPLYTELIKKYTPSNLLGEIVFIVSIAYLTYQECHNKLFWPQDVIDELESKNACFTGVPFATVWYPKVQHYVVMSLSSLKPIITPQDAIAAELKFNIDLSKYFK